MREKRRYIRFKKNLRIGYILKGLFKLKYGRAYTEDISMGGLKLSSERKFHRNTYILLRIVAESLSGPVVTTGRVLWSRSIEDTKGTQLEYWQKPFNYQCGVRFDWISDADVLANILNNTN